MSCNAAYPNRVLGGVGVTKFITIRKNDKMGIFCIKNVKNDRNNFLEKCKKCDHEISKFG